MTENVSMQEVAGGSEVATSTCVREDGVDNRQDAVQVTKYEREREDLHCFFHVI